MQADVDALKSALAGEDEDAVKTAFDKLNESQGKLGQAIYSQQDAGAAAGGEQPSADGQAQADDEDIVDAEVVDDEDDKDKK